MSEYFHHYDPSVELRVSIERCLNKWDDDPAYRDAGQKLKEVDRELDVLLASPGQRAARRALPPNTTGQDKTEEDQ